MGLFFFVKLFGEQCKPPGRRGEADLARAVQHRMAKTIFISKSFLLLLCSLLFKQLFKNPAQRLLSLSKSLVIKKKIVKNSINEEKTAHCWPVTGLNPER